MYMYVNYDFLFSNEEIRNADATSFRHGVVSNNGQCQIMANGSLPNSST